MSKPISIKEFLEKARDQLDELFAKDVRQIKTYVSKRFIRENIETFLYEFDINKTIGEKYLARAIDNELPSIRGWYILTNSNSGTIKLRFVPSDTLIAKIFLNTQRELSNKDIYITGYIGDLLQLYWHNMELYSKLLLQIDLINMYQIKE